MALIEMEKGKKYVLKSFNGTRIPEEDCDDNENYWKLLEEEGTVTDYAEDLNFPNGSRVLFQFDIDVNSHGLECHNEKPNSLWILKTDLKEIK
ncbi:hypothetical protein [Rufibacter roseolus]|uniref:hypothetical protein n=1 Tax=Rufibacter roseolus TaxID=2817375 RepID=UPI001B30549C|nr:hypothetical protein [Rufibacter roseolus]